jgi:hypothetical protein
MLPTPRSLRIGLAAVVVSLGPAGLPVAAQSLGSAFTYQGQLTDAGVPATGLFDLQLCLYDVAGGSSPLQCAPEFNDVPVDAGVFTLAVDFGSAAFVGQQRFIELRVRPGASTAAYSVLTPRQLIRATPESLRANVASAAPWSGLTGVPADFADGIDNVGAGVTSVGAGPGLTGGPITGTGTLSIATGGVVGSMIAAGAVGTAQLANNAVDSARIVDDAVAAADIAANAIGASELANNAVDSAAILDGQVTAPKIASAAVGAAQVDPNQVQLRVSGSCGSGEYLSGINADGSLACNLLPVSAGRVLDLTGDVGSHVAIALRADQRPVVAYHDQTNGNLKLYDCADAACTSGTRRILDSVGDVGENAVIAVGPGDLPVIAYRSVTSQSLKLHACTNPQCSSGVSRTLDADVNVAGSFGMVLRADGRPFVTYRDVTNFQLRVYDCDNAGCSSGTSRTPTGSSYPYGTAVALRADGRPVIALGGNAGAGTPVRAFDCADAGCASGTVRSFADLVYSPVVSVQVRSTGRPMVVSAGAGSGTTVFDCSDAACTGSTATTFTAASTGALGVSQRGDGRALILSGAPTDTGINVIDCANTTCSVGSTRSLIGPGSFGIYLGIAVRDDGRPVVAYQDADNDDLRLHYCANADCL